MKTDAMTEKQEIKAKEQRLALKYLDNWDLCPFCDSIEITAGHIDTNLNMAFCDVKCLNCGKTWTEEYKLTWVLFDEDDLK